MTNLELVAYKILYPALWFTSPEVSSSDPVFRRHPIDPLRSIFPTYFRVSRLLTQSRISTQSVRTSDRPVTEGTPQSPSQPASRHPPYIVSCRSSKNGVDQYLSSAA